MGYLSEKVAYLKGLAEGMNLDEKSDEGKVLVKLIDALEEIAASIEDVTEVAEECEERIDDLEDFADDISEEIFGGCDCGCEDEDCDCDCDDDCDCDCCDEDYEDVDFYEVECPHCGEKVYFDEDMIDNELVCPNCDGEIELEIEA